MIQTNEDTKLNQHFRFKPRHHTYCVLVKQFSPRNNTEISIPTNENTSYVHNLFVFSSRNNAEQEHYEILLLKTHPMYIVVDFLP